MSHHYRGASNAVSCAATDTGGSWSFIRTIAIKRALERFLAAHIVCNVAKSVSPPIDTRATEGPSPGRVELSRSGNVGDTQRLQALAQAALIVVS
jgi:hypothetical protein